MISTRPHWRTMSAAKQVNLVKGNEGDESEGKDEWNPLFMKFLCIL